MPTATWLHQYQKATGFFSADETDGRDGTRNYTTAFRFLIKHVSSDQPQSDVLNITVEYSWTEIGIWTQWRPSHSSVMLCTVDNGDRPGLWPGICQSLLLPQTVVLSHLCGWHAFVLPHLSSAFDSSVWSCRDIVRYMEHNRSYGRLKRPNYTVMHELARHAIHISENLVMATKVVETMEQEMLEFDRSVLPATSQSDFTRVSRIIRCQKTLLECAHGRSDSLIGRLQNEINLAFHLGTERDSAIAAQMTQAMRQDSTAMKTISVLGLVFLPGTFVSAIFGMSFFDLSSSGASQETVWTVSSKLWIYWATTIPLTLFTIVAWYMWT